MRRHMLALFDGDAGNALDRFFRPNVELHADQASPSAMMTTKISDCQQQSHSLDLDLHDLLDDRVADDLEPDRRAQHDVSQVVLEEELHVVRD